MAAPPFPTNLGYDQIVSENSSNIFNASVTAIKNSGEQQIVATFAFGAIPLFLAFVTYNKTKSLSATSLVLLMTTYGVHHFDLITKYIAFPLYLMVVITLGLAVASRYWNK